MKKLHEALEDKIKKAEKLPKATAGVSANVYTKEEVDGIVEDSNRGVAVFVSATEPTGMQLNDIWIKL